MSDCRNCELLDQRYHELQAGYEVLDRKFIAESERLKNLEQELHQAQAEWHEEKKRALEEAERADRWKAIADKRRDELQDENARLREALKSCEYYLKRDEFGTALGEIRKALNTRQGTQGNGVREQGGLAAADASLPGPSEAAGESGGGTLSARTDPSSAASLTQTETQMTKPIPNVYLRYEGEGLYLYWINPWSGKEEQVASFWWPTHPPEDTEQVEKWFEAIAERACSEVSRPETQEVELLRAVVDSARKFPNWKQHAWSEGVLRDFVVALAKLDIWRESLTPKETKADG